MRITVRMFIVSLLLAAATSLQAITYIVPSDRDLVKRAEAIVIATAMESRSDYTADGRIVTIATLKIDEVLKGALLGQPSIDLVEPGGFVGEHATMIPGSPRYASDTRYLVFLRHTSDGWATYGFGLGKFEFRGDAMAGEVLSRGTGDQIFGWDEGTEAPHAERLRDAAGFQMFIRTVAANPDAPARAGYFRDPSENGLTSPLSFVIKPLATRPDYLFSQKIRWQDPAANFDYCCSPFAVSGGLDGPGAIGVGTSNWTSAGAGIRYGVGVANSSATGGLSSVDHINAVLFNDPQNIIPAGVAALGGISSATGTYMLSDGITYFNTVEVDVVIGKSFSTNQATFNGVMTHEIGHTLGFRHSDQNADGSGPCTAGTPCTSDAIMNSSIAFNLQTLKQYDLDAAQTVYGSGPVCNAPAITGQPASVAITSGQQTTLTVTATGTSPTYQWYIGNPPTTTTPAPNGTSAQLIVAPPSTTTYWVKVSGCNTSVSSSAATVTINPPACVPPAAGTPNAVPSSVQSGQSSTLSVSPTGTGPFTYQWYTGTPSGGTPIPGATSSSTSVSPISTTSYSVRVTGQCAPVSNSATVTVTVASCVPPTVGTPFPSPSSIPAGQSSTVSVNPGGTGPFSYQWYTGISGSTAGLIPGANSAFVSVTPNVTTSYWVRVTGQCGPAVDSPAATVTVTCSPIVAPGLNAQPAVISNGQSSVLSFNTTGSGPFTIQWFIGQVGDLSQPLQGATGTSTIVSPSVSTSYWVRVSASCGSQDSGITVFVNGTVCTAPSITTQPASTTISSGTPVTLTAAASGTAPLTYQWYIGEKGDVSNLIAGATSASLTRSPAVTTKYWVRVTNTCNGTQSADSNAATVTVTTTCTNPSITTQPLNVSTPTGSTATLTVVAAGTGLHYQWYRGAKGTTTFTAGTDSATLVTDRISTNTTFWVRVTGTCGSPVDSNAATVTVTPAAPPKGRAIRH